MADQIIRRNAGMAELRPAIQKALEGFRPRFGNDRDISIVSTIGELRELMRFEHNDKVRARELRKIEDLRGARKKKIEIKEKQLLYQLAHRDPQPAAGDIAY